MSGGFFKGTSIDQDSRFPDKQKKLLAKMQFPHEYDEKVNLLPIRLELLRNWISQKVEGILGLEDEVVVDLIINSIEAAQKLARAGKKEGLLDPRELQITLTGFLEKQAKPFVLELWKMLLAAGQTSNGIAPQLLEETKAKILEAKNAQLIAAGLPPMTIATSTTTPTAAGTTVGETKPPRVSRFGPSPAELAAAAAAAASASSAGIVAPVPVTSGTPASQTVSSIPPTRVDRRVEPRTQRWDRDAAGASRNGERHSEREREPHSSWRSDHRSDRSPHRHHHERDRERDRDRDRDRHRDRSPRHHSRRSRSRSRSRDRRHRRSSPSRRHGDDHHRRPSHSRSRSRSRSPRDRKSHHRSSRRHHRRSKRSRSRSRSHSPRHRNTDASKERDQHANGTGDKKANESKANDDNSSNEQRRSKSRSRSRSRSINKEHAATMTATKESKEDDSEPTPNSS